MPKVVGRPATLIATTLLLACGLLLRLYFVRYQPFVAGDSVLYLDIAQSWVDAHTYGLSTDTVPRPTLIRLPGYPMVLAALVALFPRAASAANGSGIFNLVMKLQVVADLCTCLLVASLARRHFGTRAGWAALLSAALCPSLANYTAVPLTETFVLFTIATAYWAADRWRTNPGHGFLFLAAASLSAGILFRPDQVLLALAALPLFAIRNENVNQQLCWTPLLWCAALTTLPLVPWTVRNAVTFHVFQPLAPKSATDPGEPVANGFHRWYRTFAVDFATTEDAYWNYPENRVDPGDLPDRAFDSPEQRAATTALLRAAATTTKLQSWVDAAFDALAEERIRAHPFRYYFVLPTARLLNMLLHPRIEMLPLDERWWRFRLHPGQTMFATAYALLNLLYFTLAALGLKRAWHAAPALTFSMGAFFALRCALLLTLDNAEQRYTMEFLPLLFFLASACFASPSERTEA